MQGKEIGVEGEQGVIVGNEAQTIADVKERVLLSEWQRQIEERQSGGYSIEEWCQMQGISKGCYYHRLRRVRKYLCQITGILPKTCEKKNSESRQIVLLKEIAVAYCPRRFEKQPPCPHKALQPSAPARYSSKKPA